MLRHQLPARSPIPGSVLPRVALHALGIGSDPRRRLRTLLAERFAGDGCALTASGTHALQLALEAVRRMRGDAPVLLPAYTCYEVATAAVGAGVRVALYDLDPSSLEPDWTSVRAAARDGASAIVVAPLYGLPLDWTTARQVALELDLLLIEDAAQAHGTFWHGRAVGAFGDLSVLSFGRGKGWTGAGGGALLWRGNADASPEAGQLASRPIGVIREVKSKAGAAAQWVLGRPSLYGIPSAIPFLRLGETVYHEPGVPCGMTRVSAALLLASDEAARAEVSHRRDNARLYTVALAGRGGSGLVPIGARLDVNAGALRFPLRVHGGWSALKQTVAPRLGAAPGYPGTLRDLSALGPRIVNRSAPASGADTIVREIVTLPTHSWVTDHDIRGLLSLVRPA